MKSFVKTLRLLVLFTLGTVPGFTQAPGVHSLSLLAGVTAAGAIIGPETAASGRGTHPGPEGLLTYYYSLTPEFAVGAETGLFFWGSERGGGFYGLPGAVSGQWTPSVDRFVFPLALSLGMAYTHFNTAANLDPYLRLRLAAGYRWAPDWTSGVVVSGLMLTQGFRQDPSQNRIGLSFGLSLSVTWQGLSTVDPS